MTLPAIPPPSFPDLMKRWHGEMSRLLDAAEQACHRAGGRGRPRLCLDCDFDDRGMCIAPKLRELLGPAAPQIRLCPREQAGLCTGDEPCPHDCRKPGWECGLEDAALEAAERFQQEISPAEIIRTSGISSEDISETIRKFQENLPPAMPEGGTDVMR